MPGRPPVGQLTVVVGSLPLDRPHKGLKKEKKIKTTVNSDRHLYMQKDLNIVAHSNHDSGTKYIYLFLKPPTFAWLASGSRIFNEHRAQFVLKVLTSWQYNTKVHF